MNHPYPAASISMVITFSAVSPRERPSRSARRSASSSSSPSRIGSRAERGMLRGLKTRSPAKRRQHHCVVIDDQEARTLGWRLGNRSAVAAGLHDVEPGDLLTLRDAGAYGFVMASNYNSKPMAAEVATARRANMPHQVR